MSEHATDARDGGVAAPPAARLRPAPSPSRRGGIAPQTEWVLWWLAAATIGPGLTLEVPWLLALGSGIAALAVVANDFRRSHQGGLSAITVYALSAAAIGFANTVGLLSAGTQSEPLYYLYAAREHLFLATLLSLAGALIPVFAFRAVSHSAVARQLIRILPAVRGHVPPRQLLTGGLILSGAVLLARVFSLLPALGTLTGMIVLLPQLIAFSLARVAVESRVRGAFVAALLIAVADSGYALLFDYLRANVAAPLGAVAFGALFGARSFRVLRRKIFIPIYAAAVVFVIYFGAFGAARTRGGGFERLATVVEYHQEMENSPVAMSRVRQTVLSRLTTFNQLSQVGRVVEEDGFLRGQTLDYLAYAFVPRFVWPEKPQIAKGAWWALRIGQANVTADGSISNSVNMTIPGELYLNFGWTGVVVGCFLFGAMLAVYWNRAQFWEGARNTLGTGFGFYLFWVWIALSLGPDLQVMVTMLAMYMLFAAASIGLDLAGRSRVGARVVPAGGPPLR